MKKAFIAVALVATMGISLVSCDPDENKCWKVTYDMEDEFGVKTTATVYVWCSQNDLDARIETAYQLGYANIHKSSQSKYKTTEDCDAQNVDNAQFLYPFR